MLDFLNDIQIFNEENLIFTICIGILITIILYNLLFKEEYISDDIYQCMNKYDINQIYEFPNLLTNEECNKIIELSKKKCIIKPISGVNYKQIAYRPNYTVFSHHKIAGLIKDNLKEWEDSIHQFNKKYLY